MTNNQLTNERIEQLLECATNYDLTAFAENDDLVTALRELQERRKAAEPVGGDELDHLIWGLERYGLYPRQLAALKELRELKKAKDGEQQNQQQNIPENIPTLRDGLAAIRNSGVAIDVEKILAERDALNSPATPDGWVMVPMRLTAENGAKGALSGEFSETKFINCPECFGDDECETCDGSGRIEITVPVTWTTIKDIWAKGVEHFAKVSPKEVG